MGVFALEASRNDDKGTRFALSENTFEFIVYHASGVRHGRRILRQRFGPNRSSRSVRLTKQISRAISIQFIGVHLSRYNFGALTQGTTVTGVDVAGPAGPAKLAELDVSTGTHLSYRHYHWQVSPRTLTSHHLLAET